MTWFRKNIPGILLSFILALVAAWLGSKFPIIGGPVFGIVLGIIINNTIGKPEWSANGVKFTSRKILQWAIIVLGGSLSLTQVWKTGFQSLYVMLFTIIFRFYFCLWLWKTYEYSIQADKLNRCRHCNMRRICDCCCFTHY